LSQTQIRLHGTRLTALSDDLIAKVLGGVHRSLGVAPYLPTRLRKLLAYQRSQAVRSTRDQDAFKHTQPRTQVR
jgi:hypothetical protein